ncbi:MAG: hypothetical protein ACREME_00615 [Gemmatimonadales bacterium]
MATTGNKSELKKTIPIGRRADDKREVVMSLQPGNLGDLRDGDRIDATAEVEVSVCLKPNPRHGSDRTCIGRTYGYNPKVRAELVLGSGSAASGGASTVFLGSDQINCTQRQPNRNHHCVLVIDDGGTTVKEEDALPCNAQTCHVNLVLSAWDRQARGGHKLVVGAASDGRRVNGDKGRINVVRYRPESQGRVAPIVTEARVRPRLSIASDNGSPKEKALYSIELHDLRAGEQLVVDAKAVAKIGHHPYSVFMTNSLVLSERRDSASREGWPERVGDLNGQIAEANGFNCTQGRSGHDDPCVVRKVGVIEITRDSPRSLYVNLASGMKAQLFGDRHRGGDKAKIAKSGYLRVYRYPRNRNDSPPEVRD